MKKSIFLFSMFLFSVFAMAQSDAKALEIIQKNVEATGGKDKMMTVKSLIRITDISMPFGNLESESYHKNGKYYTKSIMQGNVAFEQKYDGNRAYMGGMQGSQILDDEKAVKRIAQQGKIFPYLETADLGTMKYDGTEKINGKECHKILSKIDEAETTSYFDATTNLLSRVTSKGDFNGTMMETTIDFSDYKALEGILFAHKMTMTNAQFSMDMKTKQIKINPEIADKMFMIE